jgi:hypothetical protein
VGVCFFVFLFCFLFFVAKTLSDIDDEKDNEVDDDDVIFYVDDDENENFVIIKKYVNIFLQQK